METEKQKTKINVLYVMLIVSTIMSFMPMMSAQIFSLALITLVLVGAYFYKDQDKEDGLLFNHMTYMIGTVWIGTLFVLVGMILAGIWVYLYGDHSIVHNAVAQANDGIVLDDAALQMLTMDYIKANEGILLRASLVTIGPAMLYFVYRVGNGFSRAWRGYRIANPKSWL